MDMGAPTAMPTDLSPKQLMTLTQWLSPAFPVGAFSYSHGLEFALQDGIDLESWLEDVLRHGAGWNDAILLRAAYSGQVDDADSLGRAMSPSAERLQETTLQGEAFCRTLRGAFQLEIEGLIYPVALGVAAAHREMPVAPVVTVYLHAFASNLVACAQRLSALGQTDAQAMIDRLGAVCAEAAAASEDCDLDDLGGSAWGADVASMQHETMGTRIFQT